MTAELADHPTRGDVPVEDLPVGAAGHQLRIIPVQKPTMIAPPDQVRYDATKGDNEVGKGWVRAYVRGGVDVADLAGVGLVGLDEGAGVRVPEAEGAVLAAAQAVVAVAVEPHCEHRPLVPRQRPRLRSGQMLRGCPRGRHFLLSPPSPPPLDGMDGKKTNRPGRRDGTVVGR